MACKKTIPCNYVGTKICETCSKYIPSRKSKYYRCARFIDSQITCEHPKRVCKNCTWYLPANKKGRPTELGIDWNDENARAEYMREYRKKKGK